MKKLIFQKLWLQSTKERKAIAITLSSDVTTVVAENEFGKSSLVKSLYATLGAEPVKIPERWIQANVSSLLKFSLDQDEYFILRYGPIFSLFDRDRKLIWNVSGITNGLAPKIASLIGFNVELRSKNGELVSPVPALCFMPFYIDQDRGWTESWESFRGVNFIPAYKDVIAEFHTGMRPKEYYDAKAQRDEVLASLTDLRRERGATERTRSRMQAKRQDIGLAFEPASFGDRIKQLIREQNILQLKYDDLKMEIFDLQSAHAAAMEEVKISKEILEELVADVKFARDEIRTEIQCPVCGTTHLNDFANRFGLMDDADTCRQVYISSQNKVDRLASDIKKKLIPSEDMLARIRQIEDILQSPRGEVTLHDMLRDESERMLDNLFLEEEDKINSEIGAADAIADGFRKEMQALDDRKRKAEIRNFYIEKVLLFCNELGVRDLPAALTKKIRPTISEAGSSQPRLFLAYYYAILHTIAKYSTGVFAPIVIDTPKQQDPDPALAKRMIQFCIDRRPEGSQLILASGSLHGVEAVGMTIEPVEKYNLLQEDQFEAVNQFMAPFINSAMQ